MASIRELEQQFGDVQARYRGSIVKAILNLIIGGGLAYFGGSIVYAQLLVGRVDAFIVLGVLLLLAGLYLLVAIFRRQIGHSVTLYEQGVVARRRGQSQALRYDEIDDVVPETGRASARPTGSKLLRGYRCYADGKVAFSITSDLAGWSKLAERLQEAVTRTRVPRFLERIQKGDTVRFTGMMTGFYLDPKPLTLSLSAQGVQVNDGPPIPWESLKIIVEADDWNSQVARLSNGGKRVEFLMENYPNSVMAYEVIKAYLQTRRKGL